LSCFSLRARYTATASAFGRPWCSPPCRQSFSSLLISLDVSLWLLWTLSFYCWIRIIESREMRFAVLIGASLGLGLLAKYGDLFRVVCGD
jgi:hypothetical protein